MAARKKTGGSLTIQFIPYGDIASLKSSERVEKLLGIVKQNKIVLLEGRIRPEEEADLIRRTMEEIDDKFKGIEISPVIVDSKSEALLRKIREAFIKFILGDRRGFTIIGPASIIKEIKQDPEKIQLLTEDLSKR